MRDGCSTRRARWGPRRPRGKRRDRPGTERACPAAPPAETARVASDARARDATSQKPAPRPGRLGVLLALVPEAGASRWRGAHGALCTARGTRAGRAEFRWLPGEARKEGRKLRVRFQEHEGAVSTPKQPARGEVSDPSHREGAGVAFRRDTQPRPGRGVHGAHLLVPPPPTGRDDAEDTRTPRGARTPEKRPTSGRCGRAAPRFFCKGRDLVLFRFIDLPSNLSITYLSAVIYHLCLSVCLSVFRLVPWQRPLRVGAAGRRLSVFQRRRAAWPGRLRPPGKGTEAGPRTHRSPRGGGRPPIFGAENNVNPSLTRE